MSFAFAECAAAVTIDFNSPTDLNLFTVTGNTVERTAGGITGEAIHIQNPPVYAASRLIYNQPLSYLNVGEAIRTSMMFHYDQLVELSNGGGVGSALAGLQLLSDPNFGAMSTWIDIGCFASQQTPADPITFSVDVSRLVGGSGQGAAFYFDPLVDEHWYRLSAKFTSTVAFPNGVEVMLTDFGMDGATFSGNVVQQTLLYSEAPLLRDSTVWAGFGIQLPKGHGNDRSDNFTIAAVPEPGSVTLALLSTLLISWRWRRS
jgi:hypothetical protein